jgi:zinc transporter ZupT
MYAGWTAMLWGMGTIAVGLGSAALVVLLFRGLVSKVLNLALCLSAGVLYALLFFHLLPESFEIVSPVVVLIGVVIGGLIIKMLDQFFHRIIIFTENAERDRFIRSGALVALGIHDHGSGRGRSRGAG